MNNLTQKNWTEREVNIPVAEVDLKGDLSVPADPRGLVIFAHGSGSSRKSSRNRFVAGELLQGAFATLLFDLLTEQEEIEEQFTRHLRFDIELLSQRLIAATRWAQANPELSSLPMGYFGASTGGGAALVAASRLDGAISAVVSRGGRPDLADTALALVHAPTLLIVGGNDEVVIQLNRQAMAQMSPSVASLQIVPGATHLFEEPGTLEQVSALARDWFTRHLRQRSC
jgi:dienelactone hydrolase